MLLKNKKLTTGKLANPRHDTTPYDGHYWFYAGAFGIALMSFGLCTLLALKGLAGWEYSWFIAVNGWPDSWRMAALTITLLGSTWGAAAFVAIAFVARMYRLAARLAFTVVGAYGVAYIMKDLIGRARPEGLMDTAQVRVAETGMGFPSGHATAITVIMLTLMPYIPYKWRWCIPVVVATVALTRLYLGVHVPLDVLGGVALGTAAVCFVRILPQPIRVLLRID